MKKNYMPLDRLAIFSFLWACYMLCQQEYYSNWLLQGRGLGWALTATVIAVLLVPCSITFFLAMVTLGGMERASRLPGAVNHLFIELLMDLALVAAFFAVVMARRQTAGSWRSAFNFSGDEARAQFYERFAPVLRLMYVIVYAFAFLAKLNYDFFNPAVSCGSVLYRDLVKVVPILPTGDGVNLLVIWGTVLIEAALPLCFSFRRTWKYGLIIGIPFHIILGLAGHRTFSIQAYAIYFLFVGPAFTEVVNAWWQRMRATFGAWLSPMRLAVLFGALALMAVEIIGPEPLRGSVFFRYNRMLLWLLWSFAMTPFFAAALTRERGQESFAKAKLGLLWIVPLLVGLNGMSQYFGIKTEHSFTMFSNLRTEAGHNNHLFMPSWLKLTSMDNDVVEIVASDHPDFQFYREHDLLLTYFEFKRMTSEIKNDFHVRYLHRGEPRELIVENGRSNQPELRETHPTLLAKLLRFRPISKGDCMECFH